MPQNHQLSQKGLRWEAGQSRPATNGRWRNQQIKEFENIIDGAIQWNASGRKFSLWFAAVVCVCVCARVTLKCQGVYTWLILTPLVSGTLIMTDLRVWEVRACPARVNVLAGGCWRARVWARTCAAVNLTAQRGGKKRKKEKRSERSVKEADEWKQTGVTFFFFHINNHTCFSKPVGETAKAQMPEKCKWPNQMVGLLSGAVLSVNPAVVIWVKNPRMPECDWLTRYLP